MQKKHSWLFLIRNLKIKIPMQMMVISTATKEIRPTDNPWCHGISSELAWSCDRRSNFVVMGVTSLVGCQFIIPLNRCVDQVEQQWTLDVYQICHRLGDEPGNRHQTTQTFILTTNSVKILTLHHLNIHNIQIGCKT